MRLIPTLLGALFVSVSTAQAQQPWMQLDQVVDVEIMPGWRDADGSHIAGLRISLAEGWMTYWRSAGAAGIAPLMDWSQSENAASVEVLWPRPTVFPSDIGLSIGYVQDVVLPLRVEPTSQAPINLRGNLDIGICRDICLPAQLQVSGTLLPDGVPDPMIEASLATQPDRMDGPAACNLTPTDTGATLTTELDLPKVGYSETVVFELADPAIWVTDADVSRDGDRLTAVSELIIGGGDTIDLVPSEVRITVIGETAAREIVGCAR